MAGEEFASPEQNLGAQFVIWRCSVTLCWKSGLQGDAKFHGRKVAGDFSWGLSAKWVGMSEKFSLKSEPCE